MAKIINIVVFALLIATATLQVTHKQDASSLGGAEKTSISHVEVIMGSGKARKQVFNPEKKGKIFGEEEQYAQTIDYSKVTDQAFAQTLKKSGAWDYIQLNTKYDFADLTNTVDFNKLA